MYQSLDIMTELDVLLQGGDVDDLALYNLSLSSNDVSICSWGSREMLIGKSIGAEGVYV